MHLESTKYVCKNILSNDILLLCVVVEQRPVAVDTCHLDCKRPRRPRDAGRNLDRWRLIFLNRLKLKPLHEGGEEEKDLAGGQRLGRALPLARGEGDEAVHAQHLSRLSVDEALGLKLARLGPVLGVVKQESEAGLHGVGLGNGVGANLKS
jgi:hypothetical protein